MVKPSSETTDHRATSRGRCPCGEPEPPQTTRPSTCQGCKRWNHPRPRGQGREALCSQGCERPPAWFQRRSRGSHHERRNSAKPAEETQDRRTCRGAFHTVQEEDEEKEGRGEPPKDPPPRSDNGVGNRARRLGGELGRCPTMGWNPGFHTGLRPLNVEKPGVELRTSP